MSEKNKLPEVDKKELKKAKELAEYWNAMLVSVKSEIEYRNVITGLQKRNEDKKEVKKETPKK